MVNVDKYEVTSLLLSALEVENHRLGVDEHIQIHDLLSLLPYDITVLQLKTTLTPLLARDAANQALFYRLFDNINELFIQRAKDNDPLSKNKDLKKFDKNPIEKDDFNQKIEKPTKEKLENKDTSQDKIKPKVALELKGGDKPPYSWNLEIKDVPNIDTSVKFDQLTGLMRKRSPSENKQLNISHTVNKAVRQLGRIEFVYSQKTEPNEYLFLIELPHPQSHRARLFDTLFQIWRKQEIHIHRFFYKGDIRLCWNDKFPRGVTLSDLQQKYPRHHLFVLGDGFQLLSPATGELARWTSIFEQWKRRAIITPHAPKIWNSQEQTLAQRFNIVPASLEGLAQLTDNFNAQIENNDFFSAFNLPTPELEPLNFTSETDNEAAIGLQILEIEYTDTIDGKIEDRLLQWIAACAIYPTIEWEWTLTIGQLIEDLNLSYTEGGGAELLTIENIIDLTRLDWFNKSKMPDAMRRVLLKWLKEKKNSIENHIRQHLQDLMLSNPPQEDSVAVDGFKMMVAINQLLLNPNADTKKSAEDTFKALAENGFMPDDFVTLSVIKREFTELDVSLPDEWLDKLNLTVSDSIREENVIKAKPHQINGWELIVNALKNDLIIQGKVKRKTKGGLMVDVNGFEAFLPGSQIDIKFVEDFDIYINQLMDFKVLSINDKIKNAVISHKAFIENELSNQRKQTLEKLEKGEVFEGVVKNITDFGAFLDLGGVDGLLYITDITWGRINHPSEVLHLNQKINVVVLDFDENKKRISLGLKQLLPHPWEALVADVTEGSTVKGKIVNIEDYGAFLEIEPGIEGLIHISEITWSNAPINAKEFFNLGQEMEARVVTIDRDDRKMLLSIKQLTNDPWDKIEDKYAVGTRHTGDVKNLAQYAVFIELEQGVGGMIRISDLSWTKRYSHPSEYTKIGNKIDVIILEINKENRQLSLGHKQIEENPWDKFETLFPIDSIHEATILRRDDRGAIVQLPHGLETFAPIKHIKKEDGTIAEVGEILNFKVIEFNPEDKRILVSHARYLEALKKGIGKEELKLKTLNVNIECASCSFLIHIEIQLYQADKKLSIHCPNCSSENLFVLPENMLKEVDVLNQLKKADGQNTKYAVINEARNLISKAKIKDAIDLIEHWAHDNNEVQLKNNIVLLKNAYTSIDREKTLGLSSSAVANINQNQLANKLLNLLDSIESGNFKIDITETIKDSNENEQDRRLNIFISYSKEDMPMMEELRKYLLPLEDNNLIETWADTKLQNDDSWQNIIEERLNTADLVLVLVSSNILSSKYFNENELPFMLNRKKRIMPIILSDCKWEMTKLNDYQVFPRNGRSIESFESKNTPWIEVRTEIIKLARSILVNEDAPKLNNDITTQLTQRQHEILTRLEKGMTRNMIADDMNLSLKTVNDHINALYKRLNVNSRVEAIKEAVKRKIM